MVSGMEGEMLKGHLDMIVLAAVMGRPGHGYGIIQEIRSRSGGAFDLPEGTVYPVLHRLEKNGLLSSRWTMAETGRKRRVYKITRRGHQTLIGHRAIWQRFADAVGAMFEATSHATIRPDR